MYFQGRSPLTCARGKLSAAVAAAAFAPDERGRLTDVASHPFARKKKEVEWMGYGGFPGEPSDPSDCSSFQADERKRRQCNYSDEDDRKKTTRAQARLADKPFGTANSRECSLPATGCTCSVTPGPRFPARNCHRKGMIGKLARLFWGSQLRTRDGMTTGEMHSGANFWTPCRSYLFSVRLFFSSPPW